MIRFTLTIGTILIALQTMNAQIDSSLYRSWSVSVGGNEYDYDSGLGIEFGTRSLVDGRLCFRVKANTVWMESYFAVNDQWTRYQLIEVMAVYQFSPIERARPYVEFGLIEIFPSKKFSDVSSIQGVGIRTGVELFVFTSSHLHVACYFGGGINQIHAVAEKMERAPDYADGFVFTSGLRFYLPTPRRSF
jgi:hypothetical protein